MIDIIPAVLPRTARELHDAANRFTAAGVRRAHLDIGDGHFVPLRTVPGYRELGRMDVPLDWDVHLMVRRPERMIGHWWGAERADRIILHVESTDRFAELAALIRGRGKGVGAAVNPETHLSVLEGVASDADFVQFMTVVPGAQGRQFLPWVLENVEKFHTARPGIPVAVDGGITPQTAPGCVHAGAGILVSGSFILRSPDVARAVQEIRDSVE